MRPTRVLLLEPNQQLRSAIVSVLEERYLVESCESLEHVLARADGSAGSVALVAWQSMEGLLAEEHRHDLSELTRHIRIVLMVPRNWARLLQETDLSALLAGMVAKPFEAEELMAKLDHALAMPSPHAFSKVES